MSSEAAIKLRRLEIDCQAPASLPQVQEQGRRFTRIARSRLGDALREQLGALENAGEAVVLIRRLELDFDVDLILEEHEIARVWAAVLKKALLHSLQGARGSESELMVFDDEAAYLAAFVRDHGRGQARGRWYYRQFEGLWALPHSAALRTALCDEVRRGRAALRRLAPRELMELCLTLTAGDARRTVAALFVADTATLVPTLQEAIAFVQQLGGQLEQAAAVDTVPERLALLLSALAQRESLGEGDAATGTCARLMAVLLDLHSRKPAQFPALLQALRLGHGRALATQLRAEQAALLLPLAQTTAVAAVFAAALERVAQQAPPPRTHADWCHASTWFGNAFLLLPQLLRLPLDGTQEWEPLQEHAPARVLRWVLLCLCQGAERFNAAARDPLLRELCGIGPAIDLPLVGLWLDANLTLERGEALFVALRQEALAQGQEQESITWTQANGTAKAWRDKEKGRWLALYLHEGAPREQAGDSGLDAADFATLWPGKRLCCGAMPKACLCVLAQYAFKSLAARLPGFAGSSLSYLLRNFLCMSATLNAEEARIDVLLTRVPLSVILNMTGLNRGALQLGDFDPRPLRLHESN
jgi:hypothetical protein